MITPQQPHKQIPPWRPPELFRPPQRKQFVNEQNETVTVPDWNWHEQPLRKKLMELEAQTSEALRRALVNDFTDLFMKTLYFKVTRKPPENINIEIKGQTRSGKSTCGITLGILISKWWGHEFTEDNILPNQSELLYRLKDAKYGETFLIDEQVPETWGEGVMRETEQLGMNLNICAKKCNNLLFIYPPTFTSRNSPFGLEAMAKDTVNKYVKCFYYNLERREFAGAMIPRGYVYIPKFVDIKYKNLPESMWSDVRIANFKEKKYDYDSQLEENYEAKKDSWIEDIRNMDAGVREKKKLEIAKKLAKNDAFLSLRNMGQKLAYLQLMVHKGEMIEMTKSELESIANMALVINATGDEPAPLDELEEK
jgi:hypothetical protein